MVFAQSKYNWPQDKNKREITEKYLDDFLEGIHIYKCFDDNVVANLEWLLLNAPNVHVKLYIDAVELYSNLVKTCSKENVDLYEDKVLEMYDQRIKYFGKEALVLNFKGQKAWKYWHDRSRKEEGLFHLCKKVIEKNGNNVYPANIIAYMDMACRMKEKGKLTEEEFLQICKEIEAILNVHLNESNYQIAKEEVNRRRKGERVDIERFEMIEIKEEELETLVFVAETPAVPLIGEEEWNDKVEKYCEENYPQKDNGKTTRVYISFIIEKDGWITDLKILKGVDESINKVALTAIRNGGRWIPAKQGGRKVRLMKRVPVKFKL